MANEYPRGETTRAGRKGGRLAAVLILAAAAGCFFEPRDAEDPNQTGAVSEPAKSPEEVVSKLQDAFTSLNVTQYEILLSDDYLFRPDRLDSTDFAETGVFPFADPWDVSKEDEVFNRVIACFNDGTTKAGAIQLSYGENQEYTDSSATDYSRFDAEYTVGIYYVTLTSPSREDSVKFDGSMKLFIRDEGDGTYAVYRWEDIRGGNLPTWGNFKGQVAANQDYCPE